MSVLLLSAMGLEQPIIGLEQPGAALDCSASRGLRPLLQELDGARQDSHVIESTAPTFFGSDSRGDTLGRDPRIRWNYSIDLRLDS
jgi:hypothetical protein